MGTTVLRKSSLAPLGLLALGACGAAGSDPPVAYDGEGRILLQDVEPRAFNVLLVSIDTLRADHLGCYGYGLDTSLRMDELASQGVVFEAVGSCSPWTTPAHVSLMTSLYPEAHGVYAYPYPGRLDPAVVTLAEILRAQGWRTAGFTEGGYAKGSTGLADGFETFPTWPRDQDTFVSHELEPSRLLENAERALAWLAQHAEQRFFLFFHTYEPHYEYRPPAALHALLAPELSAEEEHARLEAAVAAWNAQRDLTTSEKGVLYRHYLQGDLFELEVQRQKRLWPTLARFVEQEWRDSPGFAQDLRYVTSLYDAEIRFADEVVGRLLDALEEHGLERSTLVVVTSDHGEGLMDHDELQHGFHLYPELLHVPLIVRFPEGAHAGRRVADPVRSIDVMPTVLDALGLPSPDVAQGASLLPLLAREEGPRGLFAEGLTVEGGERDLLSYRRGGWKLVRDTRAGTEVLYDLVHDPEERRDVLAQTDLVLVDALRAELARVLLENGLLSARFRVGAGEFSEAEKRRLDALGYGGESGD